MLTPFNIFGIQFGFSFIAYALLAKHYVWPKVKASPVRSALIALAFGQAFRHIGLMFLIPGVVDPSISETWAKQSAYGDLVTEILALITVWALLKRWRAGVVLMWALTLVGSLDLLYALYSGIVIDISSSLHAAWYIPTFLVPAILVLHIMALIVLVKRGKESIA